MKKLFKHGTKQDGQKPPPDIVKTAALSIHTKVPPLPSHTELHVKFERLVRELGLDEAHVKQMQALLPEQKWQIVIAHQRSLETEQGEDIHSSGIGLNLLAAKRSSRRSGAFVTAAKVIEALTDEHLKDALNFVGELAVDLRTRPLSWMDTFFEFGGLSGLVDKLAIVESKRRKEFDDLRLQLELTKCLKASLNNQAGVDAAIKKPELVQLISLNLDSDDCFLCRLVLELLAVILVDGEQGFMVVMGAFDYFKMVKLERVRFFSLVDALFAAQTPAAFKYDIMLFVNSMVNSSPDIDTRVNIRVDLIHCGILHAFEKIKVSTEYEVEGRGQLTEDLYELEVQIELFEAVMHADNAELSLDIKCNSVLLTDVEQLFRVLYESCVENDCFLSLLSIVQHLIIIPSSDSKGKQLWLYAEGLVHDIVVAANPNLDEPGVNISYDTLKDMLNSKARIQELNNQVETLRLALTHYTDNSDEKSPSLGRIPPQVLRQNVQIESPEAPILGLKARLEAAEKQPQYADLAPKLQSKPALADSPGTARSSPSAGAVPVSTTSDDTSAAPPLLPPRNPLPPTIPTASALSLQTPAPPALPGFPTAARPPPLPAALLPGITSIPIPPPLPGAATLSVPPPLSGGMTIPMPPPLPGGAAPPMPPPLPGRTVPQMSAGYPVGALMSPHLPGAEIPVQAVLPGAVGVPPPMPGVVPRGPGVPAAPPMPRVMAMPPGMAMGVPRATVPLGKPKKLTVQPSLAMRSMFWSKIPDAKIDSTVWKELTDEKVALDIQELESSFCKEKKKDAAGDNEAEAKRKTAAAAAAAKPKEINLLDPKTLQNVGILLAKLRMPATEIKEAVLAMDQHKLGLENVMALRALAPTSDDISTLREFEGDASTLGKVEKFFLEITDIARYTQRLDCWIYKLKFDGTFEGMDATIRVVVEATHALSSSMQFKRLLEVVLALGNYLNGGTARGGLYGFKLDALLKLATIKSVDNTQSLMNYLVAWCEKNAPELLELATSLEVMEVGCRVSLQQWMADFNSVESSFKMLEKQIEQSEAQPVCGDNFVKYMLPFKQAAEERIGRLKADAGRAKGNFERLVDSFGEDPTTSGCEQFFGLINEFMVAFNKARRENDKRKAMEEKALQKRKAEESRRKELHDKKTIDQAADKLVDNIFGRMKEQQTGSSKKTPRSRLAAAHRSKNLSRDVNTMFHSRHVSESNEEELLTPLDQGIDRQLIMNMTNRLKNQESSDSTHNVGSICTKSSRSAPKEMSPKYQGEIASFLSRRTKVKK